MFLVYVCACMHFVRVCVRTCKPFVCMSVSVCKSPATYQYHSSALSLHQRCHKIMCQGVNHAGGCGAMVTRGFLAEHFCEQHQGEGNSRDHSTEQINPTTARSHTSLFFSSTPLWSFDSSNHSSGINPDPCKKEAGRGHMQTKCFAIPYSKRVISGI